MIVCVLQQILQRTGKLFESGSSLESHPHANQEAVTQLMGKVKHLMGDFDRRLSFRKKKVNDSVRLHQLTEAVSNLSPPPPPFLHLSLLSFPLSIQYKVFTERTIESIIANLLARPRQWFSLPVVLPHPIAICLLFDTA